MSLGITPLEIVAKGTHPLLATADHWQRVFLSDVAHVQNGFAFKSAYFHPDDGVPLVRIRDIANEETEHRYFGDFDGRYLIARGDILIGMDGDFVVSRWKGGQALLNQRVCKVTLTSDWFDERFLFLCLQPFLDAINAETSSVTVKHLSSRTIEQIPLPLPPLSEQHRIVAKIEELFSELDKGIESLKTACRQLGVYRQSVLKHAFEGKLTAQWREENKDKLEEPEQLLARIKQEREARYAAVFDDYQKALSDWRACSERGRKPVKPERPHDVARLEHREKEKLPSLPPEWVFSRMGLYIDEIEAGKSFKCLETEPSADQVGVAKVSAVTWGEYDETESKTCLDADRINENLFIQAGDFLLSRANTIELVGASVIAKTVTKRIMLSDKTLRIHFTPKDRRFFLYYLRSPYGRAEIEGRSTGNQESMRNIGQDRIKSIILPVCTEVEQGEIVRILDSRLGTALVLQAEIDDALARTDALRQSILRKAFAGRLVVQDPNDEQASVLLDRIGAEKGKVVKNNHSKKTRKRKTMA